MNENLFALFQSRFPADRSAPFLDALDGRVFSYADLENRSGRLSRLLGALGVRVGDRVLVQVEKSPAAVMLYLACLRHGAVFVPLNTAYTAREVAFFITDAEPAVVVSDPARLEETAELAGTAHVMTLDVAGQGTLVEGAEGLDGDAPVAELAANDLACILYTSGTTGRSKGAMTSHGNLAANALDLHRIWGFEPADVLLHALPIFHAHGLFVALNTTLLNGSGMLFLPRFEAAEVVRLLPRATLMMGVPTFYTRLLANPDFTAELCHHMRLFISGSAPLLEETFHAFEARTGQRILERYGMTEAGMITSNPLVGERLAGSVGFALPQTEVRVVDEDGRLLGADQTGVLEITGANVFQGYWRLPEKTAEEFRPDGWFITGDLACQDSEGRVTIVGRAKDLVISGGFNVYPKEIELLLDDLDGVAESAVIGLQHTDFGEAVTAVVVADGELPTEAEIIAGLKAELAAYKVPKRVLFIPELPRNAMGKVEKNRLRESYSGLYEDVK
ncbi:MAG: malonyl-CoA synthase [Alphaproteobacteria bacterium]|jgi:malonyl-CoA/methylmalonyl-CoA synthetase|nr:malonyl-CoA synthase [Rhodospirillaceae bacterium]MDP6405800.1 malonyl-CoA synthase [Alphaproteobacteria bacterium]MDP6621120.1 malonyl-CoA synthase [Alphaproteobacteria bacterium]|tara:strand:- start:628 stop:2139 length:1512 start_codon:yes stop_codon:yes gene_type:complete